MYLYKSVSEIGGQNLEIGECSKIIKSLTV